jgi:hypothetical protein
MYKTLGEIMYTDVSSFELINVIEVFVGKRYYPIRILSNGKQKVWVANDLASVLGIKALYNFYQSIPNDEKVEIKVKPVGGTNKTNKICIAENRAIEIVNDFNTDASKVLTKVLLDYPQDNETNDHVQNTSLFNNSEVVINSATDSFANGVKEAVQLKAEARRLLMEHTEKMLKLLGLLYVIEGDRFVVRFSENNKKFPLFYYPVENRWYAEGEDNKYTSTGVLDFINKAANNAKKRVSNWAARQNEIKAVQYASKIEVQMQAVMERIQEIIEIEASEKVNAS